LNNKKIIDALPDCFPEFFNNKIGKLISRSEKENFSVLNKPDFREGSLMIRQRRYDEYEWVIYKGPVDKKPGKKVIIIKEDDNFNTNKEVFSSSLFSYPENVKPDDITVIDTFKF
jgi:hypothetical protein